MEEQEPKNENINNEENLNNNLEQPVEIPKEVSKEPVPQSIEGIQVPETVENTSVVEPPNEIKKCNKKKLYIIIIIIAVLLIGATVFVLVNKNKDDNKPKTKEELKENKKEDKKESKEESTDPIKDYKLRIYATNDSICEYGKNCTELYATVEVESKNAKIIDDYKKDYVLIKDGEKVKYYDINNKKIYTVNVPERTNYELGISGEELHSIIYYNDTEGGTPQNSGIYIISEGKIMLDNTYDILIQEENGLIEAYNYVKGGEALDTKDMYLISEKDWKVINEQKGKECGRYLFPKTKNSYFVFVEQGCGFSQTTRAYTKDFKNLTPTEDSVVLDRGEDYIEIKSNKNVIKYDENGNIITKSKDYERIVTKEDEYIIYIENNKLKITNEKNTTIELTNWENKYEYNGYLSGYYDKERLADEPNKEEGYYLLFELKEDNSKGFEIFFNPTTKEVKRIDLENIEHGYAKPVLYLYPEKETNVKINFKNEDSLTTTYPKFKNEWEVLAKPNGDLYDKNGKYYYGLYWEEKGNHKVDFNEGFYVTKDNAIEFLEEKLSYIGLNDRERNEFIMYWLPILEKNEKSLIYFELTNEREEYNKINISPSPDSLLRIAMHVKKVDKKVNIKEQKLSKFERKGFSAIEWGGVLYN